MSGGVAGQTVSQFVDSGAGKLKRGLFTERANLDQFQGFGIGPGLIETGTANAWSAGPVDELSPIQPLPRFFIV